MCRSQLACVAFLVCCWCSSSNTKPSLLLSILSRGVLCFRLSRHQKEKEIESKTSELQACVMQKSEEWRWCTEFFFSDWNQFSLVCCDWKNHGRRKAVTGEAELSLASASRGICVQKRKIDPIDSNTSTNDESREKRWRQTMRKSQHKIISIEKAVTDFETSKGTWWQLPTTRKTRQ